MTVNLADPRRPDTSHIFPVAPAVEPEPERLVMVDPQDLARFAVHDAGASGRPYPELQRDGAERRAQLNNDIRAGLADGWDPARPALLHVDTRTGLARLRDANHRTHFAAAAGMTRVPVRIVAARVPRRSTTIAFAYRGEFDDAPVVIPGGAR